VRRQGGDPGELGDHGRAVHGVGVLDGVECGVVRDPPNPRPTTLVNGESGPANVAAPPPIGRTSPAEPERACAARLAATVNSVSAASMRDTSAASQTAMIGGPRLPPVFSQRPTVGHSADSHGWPDCCALPGVTAHRAHVSRRWALARRVCCVPKGVTLARDSRLRTSVD
jgi:hypothetical protein